MVDNMIFYFFQQIYVWLGQIALGLPEADQGIITLENSVVTGVVSFLQSLHVISFIFPLHFFVLILFSMVAMEFTLFAVVSIMYFVRIFSIGLIK